MNRNLPEITDLNGQLGQIIQATLSSNAEYRNAAESRLHDYAIQTGYAEALASLIVLKEESPEKVAIQQMAALLLKKMVKASWDTIEDNDSHSRFIIPDDEKNNVKNALLHGLITVSDSKLQTGICMVIATISKYDWPEKWEQLFPYLIDIISSSNPDQVKVGVKCLGLMSDYFSSKHIIELIPIVFPHLLRIFTSRDQFSSRIRLKTLTIVQSSFVLLGAMAQAEEEGAQEMLEVTAEKWISTFISGLQEPIQSEKDYSLKIHIYRILCVLVSEWPKPMMKVLPDILPDTWSILRSGLAVYEERVVNHNLLQQDEYDSDGDNVGFSTFVVQIFDFLRTFLPVSNKRIRQVMESSCSDLSYIIIGYMQMTSEQMETWEDDPNKYVADEDDESLQYNVRNAGAELLGELEECYGKKALVGIVDACHKRLSEVTSSWKMHEAALLALGTVFKSIVSAVKKPIESPSILNVEPLLLPLLNSIQNSDSVYLRARSIWCASRLAEILTSDQLNFVVQSSIRCLNTSQDFPSRMYACKAIGTICYSKNFSSCLTLHASHIIEKLIDLSNVSTMDTLHVVLSTLGSVMALNESACFTHIEIILKTLLQHWVSNASDPLITECIQDTFSTLVRFPSCLPFSQSHLMDPIASILGQHGQLSGILDAGIELLEVLVQQSGSPLPLIFFDKVLNPLLELMLMTDDHSVLQSGASCLKYFVHHGANQLLQWSMSDGRNGVDSIMSIAAKLLNQDIPDAACLYVGGLVTQLILQLATQLPHSTICSMLSAVVHRLEKAQMPSLIQDLCLVFARLIHSHGTVVLDVLENLGQLHFVISTWLFWQPEFYGAYQLKVSISALTKLYLFRDPRIEGLHVKGDKIFNQEENRGMRTRSKTKNKTPDQYMIIPFSVRYLQVLVRTIPLIEEEEEWISSEEDSDDESVDAIDSESRSYLSNGMETGDFYHDASDFTEVEDDFEAKSDPLNKIDLKDHLRTTFQQLNDIGCLNELVNHLPENDKETLQIFLQ